MWTIHLFQVSHRFEEKNFCVEETIRVRNVLGVEEILSFDLLPVQSQSILQLLGLLFLRVTLDRDMSH